MARIIGDYIGTTFDDFIILPGMTTGEHLPGKVSTEIELAGVKLGRPYLPAAMRSVVGNDMALAAGKARMMPVAPRGLPAEEEADIVRYVKEREVKVGETESATDPMYLLDTETLGDALEKARESGHSNMPVQSRIGDFQGMFTYDPTEHDRMDSATPITDVMRPFRNKSGQIAMDFCSHSMPDSEIRDYMKDKEYRMVPVLDDSYRLRRLVFMQHHEAYKVGAAIDTFPGWERRAEALVKAGADMIFTDTADAHSTFALDLVKKFKKMFPEGPPICAGNIVTPEAFKDFYDAGADVEKLGMGPGSICTTNDVFGVGAPPFWSLIEIAHKRDELARNGRFVPIIADGGLERPADINVAMTHADAVMLGRMVAGFHESAGELFRDREGRKWKEYYGEASQRAYQATGNMHRYNVGGESIRTFQGVQGRVPYVGWLKPGIEKYTQVLKEAMSHAGCKDLGEFREKAVLLRLSERAKRITLPHGIDVIGD